MDPSQEKWMQISRRVRHDVRFEIGENSAQVMRHERQRLMELLNGRSGGLCPNWPFSDRLQ